MKKLIALQAKVKNHPNNLYTRNSKRIILTKDFTKEPKAIIRKEENIGHHLAKAFLFLKKGLYNQEARVNQVNLQVET